MTGDTAVWTGTELLALGRVGAGSRPRLGGAAYDPRTERWRRMAEAPFTREFASYAWTGTELLIWGGTTGQDCSDGCPRADGLAYRPNLG